MPRESTQPGDESGKAKERRAPRAPRREELQAYLPLVHQVVATFLRRVPPNVLRDDLVAAGTYGLVDALRRGSDASGATFEWYARIRIRGAILDELRTQDWLTRRARVRAQAQTEGTSSPRAAVVGFDDLPPEASARHLIDVDAKSPLQHMEARLERASLTRAVEGLPERERLIVTLHYFQGVPFKTIAASLQVSEPRVSQLHARAMLRLRGVLAAARAA